MKDGFYCEKENKRMELNDNEKIIKSIEDYGVGLISPLDESKRAIYKIVSPEELSDTDYYDALEKLNLDNGIFDIIKVITDSGVEVKFKLDNIEILKNNKRWIIEWYEGDYKEDEDTGEIHFRRIGKIHREVFALKSKFLERYSEMIAINGNIYDIDKIYECDDLKELAEKDVYEMNYFDETIN